MIRFVGFQQFKQGLLVSLLDQSWVYLSSLIVFTGGEFTAVFARHYGSRAGGGRRDI
jgi:uncharacterized BrkB/YihY/UPF0761 family membrane protein